MKEKIKRMIQNYVRQYEACPSIHTKWGIPETGIADAGHPYIQSLPKLIEKEHGLPQEVLQGATIVIAYFVPFTKELADTNKQSGNTASSQWALAYEETNAMFAKLNQYMITELGKMGIDAAVSPKAATFDQKKLKSSWSHRHFAYAAGLGTFGLNNMLITRQGCCGRLGTLVTNLKVLPDKPIKEELCLYKKKGTCGVCVKHCPSNALTLDGYDRKKCYAVCQKNAVLYTEFGSSYINEEGSAPNSTGSEVCGKCVVNAPCTFFR